MDEIPPKAIKFLNLENQDRVLRVFNICLKEGIFLKKWKKVKLYILCKAGERDWKNPNSYRPISLPSVLGKTYERLLEAKLRGYLEANNLLHPAQFGFSPGRDTVDALETVTKYVAQSRQKHVVGLFLDIEGAFNNLWWSAILAKMRSLGVSKDVYRSMESYLSEREVQIFMGGSTISRVVDRGCPQGSVLGPLLWNLTMDELLKAGFPRNVKVVAFADDTVVMVDGQSRLDVEQQFIEVTRLLKDWGKITKLKFSLKKTKLIIFKGGLDHR